MPLVFEWDEDKDRENVKKHRVSFQEAKTVFGDPWAITIHDPAHSEEEDRYIELGRSAKDRVLVVVYTERGLNIRLISCRRATKLERKVYEEKHD
jgi:uncharacterized DUF497 family protein